MPVQSSLLGVKTKLNVFFRIFHAPIYTLFWRETFLFTRRLNVENKGSSGMKNIKECLPT